MKAIQIHSLGSALALTAVRLLGSKSDMSVATARDRGRVFAADWDLLFYAVPHFDSSRIGAAFSGILPRHLAPSYRANEGFDPRSHARCLKKSWGKFTICERHDRANNS
jgi:hypothetical protein